MLPASVVLVTPGHQFLKIIFLIKHKWHLKTEEIENRSDIVTIFCFLVMLLTLLNCSDKYVHYYVYGVFFPHLSWLYNNPNVYIYIVITIWVKVIVLVCSNCHNKITQAMWLTNRNICSHHFGGWRLIIKVPARWVFLVRSVSWLAKIAILCLHNCLLVVFSHGFSSGHMKNVESDISSPFLIRTPVLLD